MDKNCSACLGKTPDAARYCMHCGTPLVPPQSLPDKSRVVITGMGVVSCLGLTLDACWESLLAGRSGVGPAEKVPNVDQYACNFCGEVKGFEPEAYMDRKIARRMTESSQYAVVAAMKATEDASLKLTELDLTRTGVVIGTASGGAIAETERATRRLLSGQRISPVRFNSVWPNMAAFSIARSFNFTGYNATVVTACASGTQALATAADAIQRGHADVIYSGGTDAFNCEMGLAGYSAVGVLSERNDEPEKACRPFDADRDGLVPGEGAAVLVLENLAHAKSRGARIYAEILGYAMGSDARHETEPTPESQARTMQRAIASAGIDPEAIDYINPHATSTRLGDVMETQAIKTVFGDHAYRIPVSATKSMVGHMLGAAGAFEAVVCVLSIRDDWIHPTINYETPDPECDLDYVPNQARKIPVQAVLSNSFGFGGQNASIVLAGYSPNTD